MNAVMTGRRPVVAASGAIDRLAVDALMQEVRATPKPGLVDMANTGAHRDMDFTTFEKSAHALRGYFGQCFLAGNATRKLPHENTLPRLQQLGKAAEAKMLAATGGVNTHKGAVFSLGVLCGALGRRWEQEGACCEAAIRAEAGSLCKGLTRAAFDNAHSKPPALLTKGERMYLAYGMTGARGEAESGFATVGNISLPIFAALMERDVPLNDALVETLLHLIAHTVDTNIASRHNLHTAAYARRAAQDCVGQGGLLADGGLERVRALDGCFIQRNISPGGSADLLAVTYFLYHLKGVVECWRDNHGWGLAIPC